MLAIAPGAASSGQTLAAVRDAIKHAMSPVISFICLYNATTAKCMPAWR
jgi:hypothetical protein